MSAGYVIARENFKEAGKHVSAETDPVMFNLLFGLQSLTNQIEADFAFLLEGRMQGSLAPQARKTRKARKSTGKKTSRPKAKGKRTRRT
jgi:hypothetical protein